MGRLHWIIQLVPKSSHSIIIKQRQRDITDTKREGQCEDVVKDLNELAIKKGMSPEAGRGKTWSLSIATMEMKYLVEIYG